MKGSARLLAQMIRSSLLKTVTIIKPFLLLGSKSLKFCLC